MVVTVGSLVATAVFSVRRGSPTKALMEWVRGRCVQSRRRRLAQRAGSVQGGDRRGEQGPGPQRRSGRPRRGKPGAVVLPASATVKFAAERADADIDAVFASLDADLVGLMPVKQKVQEIAALLLVDRARQKFGLTAPRPNLHMCFTGPPGTGKTTVALRIAELLHRLGYLERGQLVHAMRDDLVGEYIGQTAPKTKRVLDRAMGGVLFIDEAYYLYRDTDSKDYGQEAIDILLQVMENDRDKLVVILAGYKDRMDEFFGSNPGMSSRIAHHLDFAAYGVDELTAIGELMLGQARYYLSADAEGAFRNYLTARWTTRGSPTPAASATSWSAPASPTPTVWPPTCTATGPAMTSCASSPTTSSPPCGRRKSCHPQLTWDFCTRADLRRQRTAAGPTSTAARSAVVIFRLRALPQRPWAAPLCRLLPGGRACDAHLRS